MAVWEIRLANQPPVKVEVDDERNLVEEYQTLEALHDRPRWQFWHKRPSVFWQITEDVVIHKDIVAGVVPKKPKPGRRTIGFAATEE